MKTVFILGISTCIILSAIPAMAHKAHVHGNAEMNLMVEDQNVGIELISPFANFISFEHTPETDAEMKEIRNLVMALHQADKLFVFPERAECRLERVSLESEIIDDSILSLDENTQSNRERKEEHDEESHGDLKAEYSFICEKPDNLKSVKVGLFALFPDLHEIHVQMITPKGQGAIELNAQSDRILW